MATGLGNARLAIPKVNRNPQPPKVGYGKPLAKKIASKPRPAPAAPKGPLPGSQPSAALTQAAQNITNTNFSNPTVAGSTSAAAAAAPPAPTAPVSPPGAHFTIPSYTPADGQPDPRDAAYYNNVANLIFQGENSYRESEQQESKSNTDYNYALQQAIVGRQRQEHELGENSIKGNLSASGWLNRNQAEQTQDYTENRAHSDLNHKEELQAFAAARKALEEGFGIEAAAELIASAKRYGEAHEAEAEEGESEYGGGGDGGGAPGPTSPSGPGYKPGSPGNKNNTKQSGISNNQKAGAGNNKGKQGAISNNQVAGGGHGGGGGGNNGNNNGNNGNKNKKKG